MNYNADINGILIDSDNEYRNIIVSKHGPNWINAPIKDIYNVFGKPRKYPFVMIELNGDPEPVGWGSQDKELVKVYF